MQFLIKLKTCELRPFQLGDVESIARHANNQKIARNLRDIFPHPYRSSDAECYINFAHEQQRDLYAAIVVDGAAGGAIAFRFGEDVHRRSAEIGYWIGEEFWGKGIATEATIAITEHAFSTTDMLRAYACVYSWNPASARVLEKAGYVREGVMRSHVVKDGEILDALVYAKIRPAE